MLFENNYFLFKSNNTSLLSLMEAPRPKSSLISKNQISKNKSVKYSGFEMSSRDESDLVKTRKNI